MDKTSFSEEYAMTFLPLRIASAVKKTAALYNGKMSEIRLRSNCTVYISAGEKNVSCGVSCTADEVYATVRTLCGNSLYCHSETVKEGYICVDGGIRAGVCGRAVTENGRITAVTDISSVVMRIPHRFPGAADELCRVILEKDFRGMVLYSPPGEGKTTALREICARLASPPYSMRVAVVDTRFEICGALGGKYTVDALYGYPRAQGIETAVRCLCPQLILCDEIGNEEDAAAVMQSMGAGVPAVITVHGGSIDEIMLKPYIKSLLSKGAFNVAVGIERRDGGLKYTFSERETVLC